MKNNIRIVRNEPDPKVPSPPDFGQLYGNVKKPWFRPSGKTMIYAGILVVAITAITMLFRSKQPTTGVAFKDSGVVKPPIPGMDVAYDTFEVNVAAGDTILYRGRTRVVFAPGSIIDKNGKPVEKTRVVYREFQNQSEIMLSGIPMMYDTAGNNYLFESGGMFELRNLNPGDRIKSEGLVSVSMYTTYPQTGNNWYQLDTRTGRWDYLRPVATEPAAAPVLETPLSQEKEIAVDKTRDAEPAKIKDPVISNAPPMLPPKRKDPSNPTFSIEENFIPELQVYTNVDFEVLPGQGYDAAKLPEVWDYITVKSTRTYGLYVVTLINAGRKYSYKARPVFASEADYNQALKAFREKEAEQNEQIAAARKKAAAEEKEQRERLAAEQRRAAEERREQQSRLAAEQRRMQASPASGNSGTPSGQPPVAAGAPVVVSNPWRTVSSMDLLRQTGRADTSASPSVMTGSGNFATVPVSSFGFYNCDRPIRDLNATVQLSLSIDNLASGVQVSPVSCYQYFLDRNACMFINYAQTINLRYNRSERYLLLGMGYDTDNKLIIFVVDPNEFRKEIRGKRSASVSMKIIKERFESVVEIDSWIRETYME